MEWISGAPSKFSLIFESSCFFHLFRILVYPVGMHTQDRTYTQFEYGFALKCETILFSKLSGLLASRAALNSELEYVSASASHVATLTRAPPRSTTSDVGAITPRICDGLVGLDGGPAAARMGGGRPMMGQLSQNIIISLCVLAFHNDESNCICEVFLLKNSFQKLVYESMLLKSS